MKQLLLIVAFTIAATSGTSAEPAESTSVAKLPLARRLYEEGVDAVGKGQWSIAFDRFKASYELAPRVMTLFNLAGAQAQTGRLIEAAENYRRFLRETTDGRYPELLTVATNQLELLDKQIAQIILDVTNIESGDVIAIDEIEFPHVALREVIPMNPGPHTARVSRGGKVIATRTLALAAGAVESIRIELPAKQLDLEIHQPAEPATVAAKAPGPMRSPSAAPLLGGVDHGSSHTWLRSPWLWSAVAVVVAGSATGAYLLTRTDGVAVH
jgi:hypothetical protein